MKAKVTDQGLLIPKHLLEGVEEVEIRLDQGVIVVVPVTGDPILQLGKQPVVSDVTDASEHHNRYIYGR